MRDSRDDRDTSEVVRPDAEAKMPESPEPGTHEGASWDLSSQGRRPGVVQVLTRPNLGGAARAVVDLASRLPSRFEVRVLAGRAPASEGELDTAGVRIEHLPLVRPIRPADDLAAFFRLRRLLRGCDVVHTHMAKAGALGRLAAASLSPRPAIVHTYHGHVLEGYFGRVASNAFLAIERSLARISDALVAVSEEVRDDLLSRGVGRFEQWHVIPLGVDLERFADVPSAGNRHAPGPLREQLGLDEAALLVGSIGRLAAIKDHATLIRAVAKLDGVHVALLGGGELEAELRALAKRLGVTTRVHFVGWWDDVASALGDLDLVVSSSRMEGTPLALIEAAAAGRAVVATDVGGVGSVVEDGRTGLLVRPGDPVALAEALAVLAADPRRRDSLGAEARRTVVARFGMERFVEAHAELYSRLIGRA